MARGVIIQRREKKRNLLSQIEKLLHKNEPPMSLYIIGMFSSSLYSSLVFVNQCSQSEFGLMGGGFFYSDVRRFFHKL